ncbi:MAG: cation transporter, partial [Candidatus Thalassarchaeaceae archaeon]|nr:cation transporter [Candidatus Thalassarchaeaceae archaeon]
MDESEEFILVEDDDEVSTSTESPPEAMTDSQNVALSERFSRLTKGISEQVDAVKDRLKPRLDTSEPPESSQSHIVEDLSIEIDGVHLFEWPIKGMDCPDCAAKAKRATLRLPGVSNVSVSATMGTFSLSIDLGVGHISRVSSLLSNLGHEPDVPWQRIQGVTATILAEKNNVSRTELRQLLTHVPAILDVRFEDGAVEVQIVPNIENDVTAELENGLERIMGSKAVLKEVQNQRLDSGQWRLVSSIPAVLILIAILIIPGMGNT